MEANAMLRHQVSQRVELQTHKTGKKVSRVPFFRRAFSGCQEGLIAGFDFSLRDELRASDSDCSKFAVVGTRY
jgi:hypothetical protein